MAVDRGIARSLVAARRAQARVEITPYANALASALERRVSHLSGLRAFVETRTSADVLRREFAVYADGLSADLPGLRALQLLRDGRVLDGVPRAANAALIGVDLYASSRPALPPDVARTMQTGVPTISIPGQLRQGGTGLIVRQRITTSRPDFPDLVAMVVDLPGLFREAEQFLSNANWHVVVLDKDQQPLVGDTTGLDAPESLSVSLVDGMWHVLVAPREGWPRSVEDALVPTRVASAVIVLLVGFTVFLLVGSRERLTLAVDERTRELAIANAELQRESEERRALEERLRHSQRMEALGSLAGGVAHDFNNLLSVIGGFGQMADQQLAALNDDVSTAHLRESLSDIQSDVSEVLKACEHASQLTSQLLAFSRQRPSSPSLVDLNAAVADMQRMLQRLIGTRITLESTPAIGALPVLADPGQLSQVLVNLVVNARDAMPDGGTICIATRALTVAEGERAPWVGLPVGDWIVLSVEDSGVGIPPDVLERVFDPFFTTKPQGRGTGLGLSTVYGIVAQAGGRIFVASEVGRGTDFTVVWPRHQAVASVAPVVEGVPA